MGNFLPDGYEVPKTGGKFLKLQSGENRLRILCPPIFGYVGWASQGGKDRPVRQLTDQGFEPGTRDIRHFWAVAAWDYATSQVKVWEFTQATIQTPLQTLSSNKDWGDPRKYDVTVTKTGSGMETEYAVIPVPPKPAANEIKEAWKKVQEDGFDLKRLYANGDPFSENGGAPAQATQQFAGATALPPKDEDPDSDLPF